MIIGIPKEIKNNEARVAITPKGVHELVARGHKVLIEQNAGEGSHISDDDFTKAGAVIADNAESIWREADILLKVKEPVKQELEFLAYLKGKILFTYLHLSGVEKRLTEALLENNVTAVAYETVENENAELPLLKPMSEIAAIIGVEEAAHYLKRQYGGRGMTLGEITGVFPANIVIVGGGIVGTKAARTAAGMGAHVVVLEKNLERISALKNDLGARYTNIEIMESTGETLSNYTRDADVLIGAVLVKGAAAPKIVTREMIANMKKGAVVVDIAIDQGGCTEFSHATTHSDPIFYSENGVIFYCVANMPGQAPLQSTYALTNATLPYILKLANESIEALRKDPGFACGLNTYEGHVAYKQVAEDLNLLDNYKEF